MSSIVYELPNYQLLFVLRSFKDIVISMVKDACILILANIYCNFYLFKLIRIVTSHVKYSKQIKRVHFQNNLFRLRMLYSMT